jgi:hypothetical protein
VDTGQIQDQDRRIQAAAKPLGSVLSVSGSQARVGVAAGPRTSEAGRVTVGKFIGIRSGRSLIIGMITEVTAQAPSVVREQGIHAIAQLDLMGEIKADTSGKPHFARGVNEYPSIGDPADLLTGPALRLAYDIAGSDAINIGHLNQDNSIGAYVSVDEMLSKHFALLGTTGVGKSSGVVLILQQILAARPNLRVFLLDAHNEYSRCFGDRAHVVNPRNLKLPFWLFNFEEMVDVLFSGRTGIDEELEILNECIPLAKGSYTRFRGAADRLALKKGDPKSAGYNVDTPVPYMLADLISLIDERMGKLENRSSRMKHHKLIQRIEALRNDPRYSFMFDNANVGGDTMAEAIGNLFRLPANGKPMTIMQLAGFPAEVIDAVVSVLCRMAFDFGLWSDGAVPLLFICEEAHRYAAADRSVGFGPTRRAISRIAKEGRKYGVFLGLVTQRPAELDPTIISQCSTLFVMRMANDRDQALVRSAVSDAAANLLAFVPSLGTREVIAFGEGVALPARLTFKELAPESLPAGKAGSNVGAGDGRGVTQDFIANVLERWRGAMTSHKVRPDDGLDDEPAVAPRIEQAPPTQPAQPAPGLDPDRFRLLRRPIGGAEAGAPIGLTRVAPAQPQRFPQK